MAERTSPISRQSVHDIDDVMVDDCDNNAVASTQKQTEAETKLESQTSSDVVGDADRPPRKPRMSKAAKKARMKAASLEEAQFVSSLPAERQVRDASSWSQDSIITRNPSLSAASTIAHDEDHQRSQLEFNDIQRQFNSFRFPDKQVTMSSNNADLQASADPPSPKSTGYRLTGSLPAEFIPRMVACNLEPIPEISCDPAPIIHDPNSGEEPAPRLLPLPRYATFFKPRLPVDGDMTNFVSPIPKFDTIEQAMAQSKELTNFHMGILLADEAMGTNADKKLLAYRKVVEEKMPVLSRLGVLPHSIVFYYHGRGFKKTGDDLWHILKEWEEKTKEARSTKPESKAAEPDTEQEDAKDEKQVDAKQKARARKKRAAKRKVQVDAEQQANESQNQEALQPKEMEGEEIRPEEEEAKEGKDSAEHEGEKKVL